MAFDFESYKDWAKEIESSIESFKKIVSDSDKAFSRVAFSDDNLFKVGSLYYFQYNPRWKYYLSEYDKLPLSIFIGKSDTGNELGINIHFLPVPLRKALIKDFSYSEEGEIVFNVPAIYQSVIDYDDGICLREYILNTPFLLSKPRRITKAGVNAIVNLPSAIVPGGVNPRPSRKFREKVKALRR